MIKENKMVFRVKDNLLYEINLNGIKEDEFLKAQEGGKIKFIKLDYKDLPALPKSEKRVFNEIFYKLNSKGNLVIDKERTEQKWIEDKYKEIENYIYLYYPPVKQQSDVSDKVYYETLLKAKNYKDIELQLVNAVTEFLQGKTFDEILTENNVADEDKEPILQLLKLGIRVAWVINCKKELKQAINEKREPKYPRFYL